MRRLKEFEKKFAKSRPFVWHLTAGENMRRIRRMKRLDCATAILTAGGRKKLVRQRRPCGCLVSIAGESVHVRDQKPLHDNNMQLPDDWSFEDWVKRLNGFVFFWPGTCECPKRSGNRHFMRYVCERPAVIRVPTKDLFEKNQPLFSRYNSGSPHRSNGNPSPRGPATFTFGDKFSCRPSRVVEVAFRKKVALPDTSVWATIRQGPKEKWKFAEEWRPLSQPGAKSK